MVMRAVTFVIFFAVALTGCSGISSVPYEEPAQSEDLAHVRVITNSSVYGDSIMGSCAPATRHKMADAGRFGRDGTANINYPQYPLKSASVRMPKRVAPTLTEYVPATRMGEGVYKEVVTEYRVRTDLPFQIATLGATIGGNGSTYLSCAGQAVVYKLEPGKDYEALVGVRSRSSNDGEQAIICMFGVIELVSLPGTSIVIPQKLTPAAPPQVVCKN
ncbi:putative Lipoprotein [Pseudomonas savastanoi pv. phaseolicola]|nr:putative Lipoprotein [Pseudomonas savastanoi pv. phaseolicola]